MDVNSVMTKKVITIDMDTQLLTICNIFKQKKFHHLLVIENNELVGVISDRDVLKAISPFIGTLAEQNRDLFTLKKKAHQIMSRKPFTISKEISMEEAANLMIQNNISCLPVISFDGKIEGIVTWKDLIKVYAQLVNID